MIAYNKTWLANLRLRAELKRTASKGNINNAEFKVIEQKYPVSFYTPGLFARIGLFVLTCIVVSFGAGLLSLFLMGSELVESGGWLFFLGGISYAALEFMVSKKHYRSGVDDALLFISACQFVAGFAIFLTHGQNEYLAVASFVCLLNLWFCIRFGDVFMATVCCLSFLAFIFFGWTRIVDSGLTTVAFIMMLVSGGLYGFARNFSQKPKFINYENCLIVGQIIGLVALYAAGNYFIVQTLSEEMMGRPSASLPFCAFFWAWTIALPLLYVGFGIRQKNVILLRTGLLLIAASAVTFRNYYHVLPLDTTLTVVGMLLLGISIAVIRYLKTPKYGFTSAQPDEAHLMDHLKVESLIIAEKFAANPATPAGDASKFGGGDFGGGGSESDF